MLFFEFFYCLADISHILGGMTLIAFVWIAPILVIAISLTTILSSKG